MKLMDIGTGTTIKERYEILQPLGEGGFARVFRAEDKELKRIVAIKFLKITQFVSRQDFERFQREARLLAPLVHRNIVSIYAFELTDDSMPFIVMEYLQGQSLAKLIQSRGKLDIEFAQDIFVQVCDGLAFAHRAGIVHRDLSPTNIFLTGESPELTAKIIDFGLSKAPVQIGDGGKLTKTGVLVGNPAYMSPEQARAEPVNQLSDIYAFGCIMYETLSGKPPLEADNPIGLLYQQQHDYPSEPIFSCEDKAKERQFKAVILRCIQKEPALRFQSCEELALALSSNQAPGEILDTGNRKLKVDSWSGKLKDQSGTLTALHRRPSILLFAGCLFLVFLCWSCQNNLIGATTECFMRLKSPALLEFEESYAGFLLDRHRLEPATKLYEDLLSRGSQQGDAAKRVELRLALARCYFENGFIDRGFATLEESLDKFGRLAVNKHAAADFLPKCSVLVEQFAFPGKVTSNELLARAALLRELTNDHSSYRRELRRVFENLMNRSIKYAGTGVLLPDKVIDAISSAIASDQFRLNEKQHTDIDTLLKIGTHNNDVACRCTRALLLNSGLSPEERCSAHLFLIKREYKKDPVKANELLARLLTSVTTRSVRINVLAQMAENEEQRGDFKTAWRYIQQWRDNQADASSFPNSEIDWAEIVCLVALKDMKQARQHCQKQVNQLKLILASANLDTGKTMTQGGKFGKSIGATNVKSQFSLRPVDVQKFFHTAIQSALLIQDEELANRVLRELIVIQRKYAWSPSQKWSEQLRAHLKEGRIHSPALKASIEELAVDANKVK